MTDNSTIIKLTAAEIAGKIASGELTAVEVTEAHLARIDAVDEKVHAFLHIDREGALAQARAVDAKREAGEKLGPLAGVPLALKDIFTTKDMPTTVGSKILEGWVPPYDATLTQKLRAADVVILGKTNMDEFAMGSSTENSAYGPTGNPWDLTRIPGGSGGGSSAALASYEAPLAIGTDTGGSIRQPAAVTGTVGVKPTYGGVSRYGMVAFSSSLDQGGPCARTVLDAALLHEAIAGHDPLDSTSIDAPVPLVVEAARNGSVQGMRVGVVKQFRGEGYQGRRGPAVRRVGRAAEVARRHDRRAGLPVLRPGALRVLPDRPVRVLLQPGPLRRHALRPAGRRRRHEVGRGRHRAHP
ncbi:Asp-tRNA(Asn)/Glu-tRNA(Gln) amidotransferase A subunit family amidase [Streptomyces sp. HB372]|nr:Asp-tRNA(Asn)/Glu-tRNA(Gln) amidotransferase A subunit family amidase [Streptomyces sp. HB372]